MRRSRYDRKEESRETIIRGRYRESHVPKPLRSPPRKKQPPQKHTYRQRDFQQQRDEWSTASTEKSSLYNYNTDRSSHTQQMENRTTLSKPSLRHIAESAGATLAAAAISPFDEDRGGFSERSRSSFFEDDDDDLRQSPSDELPLHLVEKAIDKVVDATCGDVTASGTKVASILAKSYLKTEEEFCCADGIVDPIIPNPFEGLRSEVRPIYEAASFPNVTFREVKLDPKKTVASIAMKYPERRRPMIKPKIQETSPKRTSKSAQRTRSHVKSLPETTSKRTSTRPPRTKSPIKSIVNRLKSVQNKINRRRNRPVQDSKTKKAELLEGRRASSVNRYTRARAHSDASEISTSWATNGRGPLNSQESRENTTSSITMALHECPSAREWPANERTNRARHNRSIRQSLHSDESDTSDPSLPPRLPLHKNRLRKEKLKGETSGAQHRRTTGFPSADGSSFGYESSVDPYSSIEKCGSSNSSSSLSNDFIPQVDEYILPSEGTKLPPETKEDIAMIVQEKATQVESAAVVRVQRIQSDPITTVDGKLSDPPTTNETSVSRKIMTHKRTTSQPDPYSYYQRMAEFFVPVLYRILSKCQRKSLQFHQETEKAIVPRWPAMQEYMLRELVNVAVLLMESKNRKAVKKLNKETRTKRRRRRRKRSSVLDEICNQISFLDQKLLEITNESNAEESEVIENEDPFIEDEGPPFIEHIDEWSDDEIPFEVEGIPDETNCQEIFGFSADVKGSLEEPKPQNLFGGLQSNDPDFRDMIEMAYVVTDLSRDEFIDAHKNDNMENEEDDDLEQELTNLSFVEEIIQTELSQVDSGEGSHNDVSVGGEIMKGQLSQTDSPKGTLQDEMFDEETVYTEILQVALDMGTHEDHSSVGESIETQISQVSPEEGTSQQVSTTTERFDSAEVSNDCLINDIYEDEPENIVTMISQVGSVDRGSESSVKDMISESMICDNRRMEKSAADVKDQLSRVGPVDRAAESGVEEMITESMICDDRPMDESVAGVKDQLEVEPQKMSDASKVTVERKINEIPMETRRKPVKVSLWEDDMFPDDEMQVDAHMFPDDEMNAMDQSVDEICPYDQAENVAVLNTEIRRLEEKHEEVLGSSEDGERSFSDLESVPSDEKGVSSAKSLYSETDSKYNAPAPQKRRSKFQSTMMTVQAEGKDNQFVSKSSALSYFRKRNHEKNKSAAPEAVNMPRAKQVEKVSNDLQNIGRDRDVTSLQPSKISPSAKLHDDISMDSTPSDEASEGIKETTSKDESKTGDEGKPEMPEESNRDAIATSVVEQSIDEKNPGVEIIVASACPPFDSKHTLQTLDTVSSCETEESDPICAAVNRKIAEVRQSGIPDPDDETIMETIGMTMSMSSVSRTPRSNASGAIPDPDDSMIIETLSPCLDSIKLKEEKAMLDDGNESLSRDCTKEVSKGAGNQVVMETVYFAESEMVIEKLFTVTEEGTTSSSCSASMQDSSRNEKTWKREGRQNSSNRRVREAIMKFNDGGNSLCFSPKEEDAILDARSVSQKTQSQKDKSSTESKSEQNLRQQSQANDRYTKGNAAALIARFERKGGPFNTVGINPVISKEEPHANTDTNTVLVTSTQSSSDVQGRGDVFEQPGGSTINVSPSLIAGSKIECNSASVKPSEPRQEAFYDQTLNLINELKSHLETSKRQKKEFSLPSNIESTTQTATGINVPKSPSKLESKKNSKVNQLRSRFETKISRKKSPSKDKEKQKKLAAAGQSTPKTAVKIQSKMNSSRKKLPLQGFIKVGCTKDGSKTESLIDEVKPPVHKPSKNFSQGPIDFEALNKSLLQIRREEKMEQEDEISGKENEKDIEAIDEDVAEVPIAELQLKEVTSSVSELDGPRVKMFPRGMCNCLMAGGGKSSDDNNSIEQLKKIGRRDKYQTPTQNGDSNHDNLVPPVFSMDAILDENMQRTADAAVKALEQVLTQGAANAAAAITQSDSQISCLHDCISPVTEGSFNAFSQAITHKSAKKLSVPKGDDETLTLDDNKSKAQEPSKKITKVNPLSKTTQSSHRKEPSEDGLVLTGINNNDDDDDWARIAIEENNVDDLIEALRSESSDLDPLMTVSFAPSTPMTNHGYLARADAVVSPISSDWAGSVGRLGVQPLSAAQRDEWSKRNLLSGTTTLSSGAQSFSGAQRDEWSKPNILSGTTTLSSNVQPSAEQRDEWSKRNLLSETTTLSSEECSKHYVQQQHQQSSQGSKDLDERQMDIDFRYESPGGSVRGPYDGMLKEQQNHRSLPPRTPKTPRSHNLFRDPPTGYLDQDEDIASKGNLEADPFDKDYLNYSYEDRNGKVKQPQKEQRPDYYDFPAPPSHEQFDSEMSELTMSQGEMTATMKSQDPEQALKSFQEVENRGNSSSDWLYDSKRGISTTMPSSRSARTTTGRADIEKSTISVGKKRDSSSSMWCSESFGAMIQDCFAASPSQQPDVVTKAIQDAPKPKTPSKRSRPPLPDVPSRKQ